MKRKIFSILFALVLVLTLSLVTAVPVAAATLTVDTSLTDTPPNYHTIQAAVDAAGTGDTIIVAAGVYDEQVVIGESLTLQGVGDTTVIRPSSAAKLTTVKSTPWTGTSTKPMAAIVFVDTAGLSVTVKDLKIDGTNITTLPPEIVEHNWVTGLAYLETSGSVERVAVQGYPQLGTRSCGIWASAVSQTAFVEVTGCNVIGYNRGSIYACGGTLTVDFNHNEIYGPGVMVTQVPNGMFFLRGVNGSATYNTITDLAYTGVGEYRSTGIGTYNAGIDVLFSNNEIYNVQNAFALAIDTIGTIVEYNNVHNCHTGVRIEAGATDSVIQYNDIHDNDFAIRCGPGMGEGNEAHNNNFVNNPGSEWINVEGPDPGIPYTYEGAVCNVSVTFGLDAINNWWGTTVESEIAAMVSANVNYTPWLSGPGSSVSMIAASEPARIGISVFPPTINFGAITSGVTRIGPSLTVHNIGNVSISVSGEITADTTYNANEYFYTAALKLNEMLCDGALTNLGGTWAAAVLGLETIAIGQWRSVSTEVVCPSPINPDTTYTGTVVFWAEQE